MNKTGIEWCDETWNPVSGCSKVSQGCKHCYAERVFQRAYSHDRVIMGCVGPGGEPATRPRNFTDVRCHEDRLDQPLRMRKPRRIFVNSMSDLFHEDVPFEFIAAVCGVAAAAPQHTFLVLTKRPWRMAQSLDWIEHTARCHDDDPAKECANRAFDEGIRFGRRNTEAIKATKWPLPNVWLGVSVEDQATADERIPLLLQTPAAVRFVSAEPLLGPIDFGRWLQMPLQVFQNSPRGVSLDPQVRQQGGQQSDTVANAGHFPCVQRLPSVASPDPVSLDAMTPSNGSREPCDHGRVGVVNRDSGAVGAAGTPPPVEIPFSIEQPGNVRQGRGVSRNADSHGERAGADSPEVDAARFESAARRGTADTSTHSDLGDGVALTVKADHCGAIHEPHCTTLNWVIVGGESGPGARPFDIQWARSVIAQCKAASVPVFVKQMGSNVRDHNDTGFDGDEPESWPMSTGWIEHDLDGTRDGYQGAPVRIHLLDRKGGDMSEWPEDLRVREFPA